MKGSAGHLRIGGTKIATYVITHEVEDVDLWLSSPKREEEFGKLGVQIRTFRDPGGSNKVGIVAEIEDMDAFQQFMESDDAAEAMKHDGVKPETLLILAEG